MTTFFSRIDRALSALCWAYQQFCAFLLAVMLVINAVNIVWRSAAGSAINWVWPWTMVLFLWWAMIAFYPLYRLRKDVSIYLILGRLNAVLRRVLGSFVFLAVLSAAAILLYSAPARLASAVGTIEIVGLPRWLLVVPLILSAGPIGVDALVSFIAVASGKAEYKPFGMMEAEL